MGLNNFILTCEKDNEELRKDINYYNNMTSRLKKENQELKKQLEENKDNYNCLLKQKEQFEYIMSKQVDYQGQQKEFIKYLEDEIKELQKIKETELDYDIIKDVIPQLLVYEEILQKYKEIIGAEK